MASNHVPSDQVPLQSQSIYADSAFQNLFPSTDRYGTPSWDASLQQQPGLASNTSSQAWHNGAYPQQSYSAFNQPYGTQPQAFRTPSPYQYGQFNQQNAMNPYSQPANVDPSLSLDPSSLQQHQQSPYRMPMRTTTPQGQPGVVTPQALQQNGAQIQAIRPNASPFQVARTSSEQSVQRMPSASFVKPVPIPSYEIPKSKRSGGLYILDQTALADATKSTPLNKFVTLGSEPFHLATNRTALPLYTPRQSIKELKKAGADNKKLLARISSKSSLAKALKPKPPAGSLSPLKKDVSDSDSYTESSDDDSEYTDDEDDEPSPLPAARPDEPHDAVRYDIIKAAWHPPKSSLSSEKIKDGMREVWEVLNTIHKRWRADSKAVSEAEDQKKNGELPVLKSRVASQRDLLQSALRAALEHAHPDVLYHLGQIKPFLYLCYQFLANRYQNKDYDGPLSAVIFEVLSRCGFITSELLEETRLNRALTSMKKHANEKHKSFIQQIVDAAVLNTKKSKASSPPRTEPTDGKAVKRAAPESASRSAGDSPAAKKVKPAEGPTNAIKKANVSSTSSKPAVSSAASGPQKKPGDKATPAPAPVKARINQVASKPSGIFASLNAASKKPVPAPTTSAISKNAVPTKPLAAPTKDKKPASTASKPAFSFAQTMASLLKPKEPEAAPVKSEKQLPPETAEEKAKRLRKESRRHLRVTFKPDAALVQIKYFSHDPEEEMGHDENFVRDAGDIGGEGRMFKQHKELEVDDDDDEVEMEMQPWKEPILVDFSSVSELTQGNYAPYGGGKQEPSSLEKAANLSRENATLMVFYANADDIPSSPREPLEQAQESAPPVTVKMFGEPPESVRSRASQPAPDLNAAMPDFSQLESIIKQLAASGTNGTQPEQGPIPIPAPASVPSTFVPPAPAPAAPVDLQSILSALQGTAGTPAQAPPAFNAQAAIPPLPQAPPLPADLNAIMSVIQAAGAGSGMSLPPPPPGLPPGFPPFPMPFPLPPQQSDPAAYQPQQQQQQQQYAQQPNGGTKRQREDSNNDRGTGKKHKNRGERPHKVLPCRFFQKGTCTKGDKCTYVHDLNM